MNDPTDAPSSSEGLTAALSLFEAYDDLLLNSSSDLPQTVYSGFQQSGTYTGARALAAYYRPGSHVSLTSTGNAASTYYPFARRFLQSAGGALDATAQIGRRTTFGASQTFGYAPYYTFDFFPGLSGGVGNPDANSQLSYSPPNVDFAVLAAPTYRYGSYGSMSHQLGQHTTVHLQYGRQTVTVSNQPYNRTTQTVGGGLSHGLTRHLSAHAGYNLIDGRYQSGHRLRIHDLDIGLRYQHQLSISRRTAFRFTTGSAFLSGGGIQTTGPGNTSSNRFRLTGSADVSHSWGRTWVGNVLFRRDWQVVEGFDVPFFLQSLTVATSGELSHKLKAGARSSYVLGSSGLSWAAGRHASYTTVAWLRYDLTRTVSAYSQYLYYGYDFSDLSSVPSNYPRRLNRNGARAGLTLTLAPKH